MAEVFDLDPNAPWNNEEENECSFLWRNKFRRVLFKGLRESRLLRKQGRLLRKQGRLMKHLIPGDYSRCNNHNCPKNNICKRYLQIAEDKKSTEEIFLVSVSRWDHENCQNLIR